MSETKQKSADLEETVSAATGKVLSVLSRDPSEVDMKAVKFKTAKTLDKKAKRSERLLSFEDAAEPDGYIHVLVRALTAHEESILYRAQLSKSDTAAIAELLVEKTKTDEPVEVSDISSIVSEKLVGTIENDRSSDRYFRKIQMAIVKPTGVTIEWLKRRNPNMLEVIDNTIDELQAENDVWVSSE